MEKGQKIYVTLGSNKKQIFGNISPLIALGDYGSDKIFEAEILGEVKISADVDVKKAE